MCLHCGGHGQQYKDRNCSTCHGTDLHNNAPCKYCNYGKVKHLETCSICFGSGKDKEDNDGCQKAMFILFSIILLILTLF